MQAPKIVQQLRQLLRVRALLSTTFAQRAIADDMLTGPRRPLPTLRPQSAVAIFIPRTGFITQEERDTLGDTLGASSSRVAYNFALTAGQYVVRLVVSARPSVPGLTWVSRERGHA